ncbi:TetR-like C-terminal domain-containing protein [Shouchella clausii]|uniref:TetR-like C-terminal domain-containing protein n=1 Tax=Shouchella clausii TaxID=79880 RepID=UPI001FCFC763|nr:TetR-like C-terminal domain-containing protein [Shouchella clausii]
MNCLHVLIVRFGYLKKPLSKSTANKKGRSYQTPLKHISLNMTFYRSMLIEENRIYPFQAKMETIIKDKLMEGWKPAQENAPLAISNELLIEYLGSALMGIVIWWIKNDKPFSTEEVSSQFSKIVAYGHLRAASIAVEE